MIRLHSKYGVNPTISQCFFCGKDKNEIVLLGAAYREEAPMHMCLDHESCDECNKLMDMGVMLISVKNGTDTTNPYRTGNVCVLKQEAAQRIFNNLGSSRVAFIEDEAWDKIGTASGEHKLKGVLLWR